MTTVAVPTTAAVPAAATALADQQHIVLDEMSWEFYEHLLCEIRDRHIRVTYNEGTIEIMSPLPKHERWGEWIARLVGWIEESRSIRIESLGSTTFRSGRKKKGLEPDKCFFIQHAAQADDIEDEWDPAIHPPPDLAIEIDITRRSVPREPIYAALGVPELWRFDGKRLTVHHLTQHGTYVEESRSLAFPFLVMPEFERFIFRRADKDRLKTHNEFRAWAGSLPPQQ